MCINIQKSFQIVEEISKNENTQSETNFTILWNSVLCDRIDRKEKRCH